MEEPAEIRRIARALSYGLAHDVLDLASVVAWADEEIVRRGEPPTWLIDVSTCHLEGTTSPVTTLREASAASDLAAACRTLFCLLPDPIHPTPLTDAEAPQLAEQIWALVRDLEGEAARTEELVDTSVLHRLQADACGVADAFGHAASGCLAPEDARAALVEFVAAYADDAMAARLAPVHWHVPPSRRG